MLQCTVWIQLERWGPGVIQYKSGLVGAYYFHFHAFEDAFHASQFPTGPVAIESFTVAATNSSCSDAEIDYQITWAVQVRLFC